MTTNRTDLLAQLDAAVRRANLSDRLGTHTERLAERRAATAEVARIRAELDGPEPYPTADGGRTVIWTGDGDEGDEVTR